MDLIEKFLLEKQKELLNDLNDDLFEKIKETIEKEGIKGFQFEKTVQDGNNILKIIKFENKLLFEEKINPNKSKEVKIFDINKNNLVYVKRVNENNKIISEKKSIRGYLRNINSSMNSEIQLKLTENFHIYFNPLRNKVNIWSREKEERNVLFFDENYKIEDIKKESIKRMSLLTGILKLFKYQNPVERIENSIKIKEFIDEKIGKIIISENNGESIHTFFDITGKKLIEEKYLEGIKKSLKFFEKGVCRYEESYNDKRKSIFYYNEKGKLRIKDEHNTEVFVNDKRNRKHIPEDKRNRKKIKEQKEVELFKIVFSVGFNRNNRNKLSKTT